MMRKTNLLVIALFLFTFFSTVYSAEYDFYIHFDNCKCLVGYLFLTDNESIQVMPGDTSVLACKRQSNTILCDFFFDKGEKGIRGNREKYKIIIDSPPLLHFRSETGADYVAVDTNRHAATVSIRLLHENFLGAKVCQGLYTTDFEMKHLKKE
jgi:hypothetical protein